MESRRFRPASPYWPRKPAHSPLIYNQHCIMPCPSPREFANKSRTVQQSQSHVRDLAASSSSKQQQCTCVLPSPPHLCIIPPTPPPCPIPSGSAHAASPSPSPHTHPAISLNLPLVFLQHAQARTARTPCACLPGNAPSHARTRIHPYHVQLPYLHAAHGRKKSPMGISHFGISGHGFGVTGTSSESGEERMM